MTATTTQGAKSNAGVLGSHIMNAHAVADAWKSMAGRTRPPVCRRVGVIAIDHAASMTTKGSRGFPYCGVPATTKSGRCHNDHATSGDERPYIRPESFGQSRKRKATAPGSSPKTTADWTKISSAKV
jgi:hypothetical protein